MSTPLTDEGPEQALPWAQRLLLDGLLRRWQAMPDAQALTLRGGLATAAWIWPHPRQAEDLDLLCACPWDPLHERARVARLVAQPVDDDLTLTLDDVQPIWALGPAPGLRARVSALTRDGLPLGPLQVDLGYGDPLALAPRPLTWRPLRGQPMALLAVAPEVLVGWKLHGLFEHEGVRWRCKDLHDLHLLLSHATLREADLPACIRAAFGSRSCPLQRTERLLDGTLGASRGSRREWAKFAHAHPERRVPEDVAQVASQVAQRLRPHIKAAQALLSAQGLG